MSSKHGIPDLGVTNEKIAPNSVTLAKLGDSVLCDAGAAGAATASGAGLVTVLDMTWHASARYLLLECYGISAGGYTVMGGHAQIDLVNSKITRFNSHVEMVGSASYSATAEAAAAIAANHPLLVGLGSALMLKITTFNTGTRNLVIKSDGCLTRYSVGVKVRAVR